MWKLLKVPNTCYQTLHCVHEHGEECEFGENCVHECTVESGCITVYEECQHVHDENCGYVETVTSSECGYVCEICNAVKESEQTEQKQELTAVEKVQAMIDALPDAESVTEENRASVEADLDMIDEAKCKLSDAERAELDFTKYDVVITALNVLDEMGGAEEPATVEEKSGTCGESLTWELNDEGVLTISGTGAMTEYYPSRPPWDSFSAAIKEVIIGGDVTTIEPAIFQGYQNLTTVTFGENSKLTSISFKAFSYCEKLTSISIPNSVTCIEGEAFFYCTSLTSIKISSGVTMIADDAFANCTSLTSISIPDSVIHIEKTAFGGCTSLTNVTYGGSKSQWQAFNLDIDKAPTITYKKFDHVSCDMLEFAYDGTSKSPEVSLVEDGSVTLVKDTDYNISVTPETNAGDYTLTITGMGSYANTSEIVKWSITKATPNVTSPAAQNSITYGAPLSTVGLPDGWTWADETVIPTVTNNGYMAYYTPTDLNNYDWTAIEGWNASESRVERTVAVTVNKVTQSVPTGLSGTAETIDGKADGTITGVTTAMEYRKDSESDYTEITGTEVTGLAGGTYYVRYKVGNNHNASGDVVIVIPEGRKLSVTVPDTQTGYTVTVNDTELSWHESEILTFSLAEGYSKLKDFAVKVNGTYVTLDSNGQYAITNVEDDITITVEGVADTIAPTGEIKISDNSWKSFLNSITFGIFFKDTQEVTITAEDKGSGMDKVYYYISENALSEQDVNALEDDKWTLYDENNKPSISPDKKCVVYVKAVDKAQNTLYISSDGLVFDATAPAISGIEDGKIYCQDRTVTVIEENIATVTLNGANITKTLDENNKFILSHAPGKQTIVVTDKAGNKTVMTVIINNGHQGGTEVRNAKEATCTEAGYTGDTYCKGCETLLKSGKTIAVKGHDYKSEVTKEPTTTSMGIRTYTCKNCGYSYTETIAKLPEEHSHSYMGAVTKEADCTNAGIKTYTCSCGDSYTESIPALGHHYVSHVTKEATVAEEGIMTYTCDRCGHFYTRPIAKLESNEPDNNKPDNNKPGDSNPDDSSKPDNSRPDTGMPYIEGMEDENGWDNIREQLETAKENDTLTIEMNGTTVVPGDIFDTIKGKNVSVVFDMGDGIYWKVNGKDIIEEKIGDIDFGVTVGSQAGNTIPVEIINNVTGERFYMNLTLAYNGEFGFKATLTLNVDKKNAGLYANLFYYNPQKNSLEYICADKIDENGNTELTFTHASDYTIVIDEEAMQETADTGGGEIIFSAPKTGEMSDSGLKEWKTVWILLIVFLVIVMGIGTFYITRRKKEQ